jgi:ferredoxin-NADP reductase
VSTAESMIEPTSGPLAGPNPATRTAEPAAAAKADARGARKRIKDMEVMVAEVVRETHDTTTLVLFTGNDTLDYKPGHFLTIEPHQFPALARWTQYLEDVKERKEAPRAYSLASSPHEHRLAITVKEERYVSGQTKYPPLLSPFLVDRTPPGTRMVITGFTGPYILPEDIEARTDHVVHICAGSGIVPNWSMLKFALETDLEVRHTLIYGNKTWEDVIYRRQLDELAARYRDRLTLVHAISRDPHAGSLGPHVVAGRVDEALIRRYIPDPTAVEVFACGPGITKYDKIAAREHGTAPRPRFLETALDAVAAIGVPKQRVHSESYG